MIFPRWTASTKLSLEDEPPGAPLVVFISPPPLPVELKDQRWVTDCALEWAATKMPVKSQTEVMRVIGRMDSGSPQTAVRWLRCQQAESTPIGEVLRTFSSDAKAGCLIVRGI